MTRTLRLFVLLGIGAIAALGAGCGKDKFLIPVDNPLRAWAPPEPPAQAEEETAPATPAEAPAPAAAPAPAKHPG